MADKDQKSITINDILDQLVKPSVVQVPKTQATSSAPAAQAAEKTNTGPTIIKPNAAPKDLSLPALGKTEQKAPASDKNPVQEPFSAPELKLSIRTMTDDIARLKQGEKPLGIETKKSLTNVIDKIKREEKPEEKPVVQEPVLPPQPQRAPVFSKGSFKPAYPADPRVPAPPRPSSSFSFFGKGKKLSEASESSLPPLPLAMPAPAKEEVRKPESKLPEYLGAPLPSPKKRALAPEEEKIEYRLIARVIGSGMTTGVVSTVIIAIALYFVLYYFFFGGNEVVGPAPTPSVAAATPTPEVNELDAIFRAVAVIPFELPANTQETVATFRNFVEKEPINNKEYKKIRWVSPAQSNISFTELLGRFNIAYPEKLRGVIKDNNTAFLYGQQEVFDSVNPAKGLVLVVEVTNADEAAAILKEWEPAMPQAFSRLFGIDPSKTASSEFLTNNRQGILIKYKNFPLPDKSLDYAIAISLSGRKYLVITNSRESMFSPVDKIRGL